MRGDNALAKIDLVLKGRELMGLVAVPVNGRPFAILGDDGEGIRRLAQYFDGKVAEFVGSFGQVGEARLLLLAALVIADELSDANDALDRGLTGQ